MTQLFAWDFAGTGQAAVADLSGNSRGFTPTGNTTRTAAGGGYTYGGARPNAVGLTQTAADVQTGPAITGLNPAARTICGWAKIAAGFTGWFIEWYRSAEDTGVFGFLYLSGTLRARAKNSSNTVFEQTITPSTAYRFYAMTHDGTTLKVYQSDGSGVLQQVGADISMPSAVWAGTAIRVLEQSGTNVTLSDWQAHDVVLSSAQLSTIMATPLDAAPTVSGSFTGNLPAFTGSFTGNASARGTAAGPIPALVASLAGRASAQGTGLGALPALVGSFSGRAVASAQADSSLPALTALITGSAEARGSAAGDLPGLVGSFAGTVTAIDVTAELVALLPAFTALLTGSTGPSTPYTPVTDPRSAIRPNLATATARATAATATIRANPAEAAT